MDREWSLVASSSDAEHYRTIDSLFLWYFSGILSATTSIQNSRKRECVSLNHHHLLMKTTWDGLCSALENPPVHRLQSRAPNEKTLDKNRFGYEFSLYLPFFHNLLTPAKAPTLNIEHGPTCKASMWRRCCSPKLCP